MTPEALAALHARAMETPTPWTAQDFRELLVHEGAFQISRPHAFALGRVILDEAELLTLATDPDHRRKGFARTCLAGFEVEARARGAVRAHLEVAASNTPACALYESAGWRQTGLRKAYYRGPRGRIDAIVMSKPLLAD